MSAYVVQTGDTLWKIAQRFGTTTSRLIELNPSEDPDMLFPGQVVQVPDDSEEQAQDERGSGGGANGKVAAGQQFRVDADIGLKVRARPDPHAAVKGALPFGTLVVATGEPPQAGGGLTWLHIKTDAYALEGWVAMQFLTPLSAPVNHDGLREQVLATAERRKGIPYQIPPDRSGVATLDCSLFVVLTFSDAGIPFGTSVRTADQIRKACRPIDDTDVLPGDLLFFENTYPAGAGVASHVGLSLGAGTGMMWDCHASNGDSGPPGVGQTNVRTPYWTSHWMEARRPPQLG